MNLVRRILAPASVLCLAAGVLLEAQIDTGTILGRILREDGAAAANAQVSLRHMDTNEVADLLSGPAGYFRRDGLRVGKYQLTVALPGFRTEVLRDLELLVGQSARADFQLRRGTGPGASVKQADPALLGAGRTDLGQVIDQERLDSLPVNARDIGKLAGLAAGATPSASNRGNVKVMGMRFKDNLTYIDGTLFTHGDGETSFKASTDALREFDVKTGLYSAEYGVRPGGQITAVTKSGSNQFHGNLYWFHRNDNLDARDFFEQRKAEFKRNQLGATLGGPIVIPGLFDGRDRAWFFLSYQFRSIRETRPLTGVVPTDAEKRGEFASPILDPATGQFFPADRMPEHRLDPVSRKLLHFWPSPNTPGSLNFTSPDSTANLDNPQLISRLDFTTSPGNRWAGRFIWDSSPQVSPRTFSVFSAVQPLRTYGQSISNTRTFGTGLINAAGIHWFFRPYIAGPSHPKPQVPLSLGIPQLLTNEADRSGVPTIVIQGYTGIGDSGAVGHANVGNWQVKDDVSWSRGNHTVRGGVEFRQHYNFYVMERRSRFEFFSRYTGNAFADFLLGHPVRTELGGEGFRGNFHQNSFYFYLKDVWRVRPRLTLTLGLRYELRLPWRDKRGFMANFDVAEGRLIPPLLIADPPVPQTGRFEPGFPLVEWNRASAILPRLGISFRLGNATVLRSGYGIYSNEPDLNMVQEMAKNPRPGAQRLVFLAPLEQATLRLSEPFPERLTDSAAPNHSGMETPLPLAATHSWGLSVQHRLSPGILLQVGYLGSHSSNRLETVSLNDAVPGPGDRSRRRPYPELQTVEMPFADADAWFHGMQLQVEKRPDRYGLSALVVFDWSRQIDTGGGYQGPPSRRRFRSRNLPLEANRSLSEFHAPKRMMLTAGYDLPFGAGRSFLSKGAFAKIAGGWSIRVIASFQDGGWFTVYLPGDPLDTGSYHSQWPDRIRNPNLKDSERSPSRWFDTGAFRRPGEFLYGNAGRSSVEGPGVINLDLSLRRTFHLQDTQRVELRLEAFNATNHPNFLLTGRSRTGEFGTSEFGALGHAQPARQLQMALKFYF